MQFLSVTFLQSKCWKVLDANCSRSVHVCTFRNLLKPPDRVRLVGINNIFRKPQCSC